MNQPNRAAQRSTIPLVRCAIYTRKSRRGGFGAGSSSSPRTLSASRPRLSSAARPAKAGPAFPTAMTTAASPAATWTGSPSNVSWPTSKPGKSTASSSTKSSAAQVSEGGNLHGKLVVFLCGARPHASRAAAREDKQIGEVNRVPSMNHKSAEPINVGEAVTSDTPTRPASDPAMSSTANRRLTPRQSISPCQRGSGQGSHPAEGEPACFSTMQARGEGDTLCQPTDATAESGGPNPYGVESGSTAGQGKASEPGNPLDVSFGMAETTGDHGQRGRSLRIVVRGRESRPHGEGKRVDTASTQGGRSSGAWPGEYRVHPRHATQAVLLGVGNDPQRGFF